MPYPWVQIVEGNPPSAAISLPPSIQRLQRPSVVSVVDDEPMREEGQGVEVIRARKHVVINKVNFQCNAFSQAHPARIPGHVKYPVRCSRTGRVICRWSMLMSDAVLFVARDVPSARRLLRAWDLECRGLPPIHRPVGSVVVRNISENIDLESLASMFVSDGLNCYFGDVKVTRGVYKPGMIPDDVLSRIRDVRKKRREEKTLWDWYTLFRVSRGCLQQLASAPEAAPGMNLDVSYVAAFDQSRLPQPLMQMRPWLEEAWREWIQQAMSLDDLRQMRLPILANALSQDMVAYYDGFCGQTVFGEMYHDALTKALSYQRLMPMADAKALVTSVVKTTVSQLRHADPEERRKSRTHFLHRHSASVAGSRSSRLCLVCFVQPPEVFLPCECALCETCYRGYGNSTMSGTVITFDRCVLCATAFVSGCAVRLRPPTAGCRVLALDGGGVKGIVQLRILQMLQKVTGLPVQIFFDLAIGTSVGGINALSIGVLESSLDTCEQNFIQLARRIFPKASTKIGRWCQKLSRCIRFVCKDSIYSPSGPILGSITGEARLRGPRKSLYNRKPYEQMKVAVTSIDSKTSMSKLFTTYAGHENRQAESGRPRPLLVREAAEITSAAPVYFPAKRLGSSTSSYYDGLEIPLLHARSEALRLCPRKTVPDYILSAGNGVMKAAPNGMSNSLSRFAHFSLESLWGHRQYQRLGGSAGEAFNEFRIDPTLDMEAVALDDADAISKLIRQLDREFLVNRDLHQRVQQVSLVMIASLFYFSFDTTTRTTRRGEVLCRGFVACRYGDDPSVTRVLATRFKGLSLVVAGNKYKIAADERTVVSFTLPSLSVPFDIRLKYNDTSSSISGFPQTADALLDLQAHSDGSVCIDESVRKRKLSRTGDISAGRSEKKRRMDM
ncbi:hypothetical protein BDP55DRAFT_678413 [Colletotrichum godetiae]|uniref:PNPLA domain-containing protein n=1 Tax=Colletotrichum godetiae TaxID=1209918 RepID=A0AAJ0ESQ1_9PEZI|nr:uncharacterized protein BDP55DRAFT_678413 [Colletotrichum godetiae]KAK1659779.1 hypothetical protein BDP55DRAFT_678413 [Colletotrichum godetiae]